MSRAAAWSRVRPLDASLSRRAPRARATSRRIAAHGFDARRGLRDAHALRLPRPRARGRAMRGWLTRRRASSAVQHARADLRRLRGRRLGPRVLECVDRRGQPAGSGRRDRAPPSTPRASSAAGRSSLHLGLPRGQQIPAGDNDAGAMRRSLETIAEAGAGRRRPPGARGDPERPLDAGGARSSLLERRSRARRRRRLPRLRPRAHAGAARRKPPKRSSGHVITTHVHDNDGRDDIHLVPFDGTIDWTATLMAMWQDRLRRAARSSRSPITATPPASCTRTVGARTRLQAILDDLAQPFGFTEWSADRSPNACTSTSKTSRSTKASPSRIKGWLANRRSSGKIHFLQVRDGSGFIQAVMSKAAVGDDAFTRGRSSLAGDRHRRARARCARTRARPAATRSTSRASTVVSAAQRLPDHAEGARRRLPDGSAPPVDSHRSASRRSCACATKSSTPCATTSTTAASSSPTRRSSRRRPARARRRSSRCSTSTTRRRTSRRAASSTTKPTRWRSAACTASARRSARRNRRRGATSPSSGWSSPRSPTRRSTTSSTLAEGPRRRGRRPRARAPRSAS